MPGGNLRLDVRFNDQRPTTGCSIYLTYNGIINRSDEVAKRNTKGEVLTSADEYFLTSPIMETSSNDYLWLNRLQCIGKMVQVKKWQGRIRKV